MAKRSPRLTSLLAGGALLTVSAAALVPAHAEPAPPDAAAADVVISVDPTYQNPDFQGWGTSLIWFANATGDYPDAIREELYQKVFGEDGLRLNIARYNVGGGNAPDVPDYLRPGGAVEGWWNAPDGTTRTDVDWWDADDAGDWNNDADQAQRWWVERAKNDVTHWEAFSNSPPWFQTESGYTSGGFDSSAEQIPADQVSDFAAYMVGAVERLEEAHDISFDTIDPVNEPNTNYWGTTLGADGNPTGGRQEGAHVGPARQSEIIQALAATLAQESTTTDAVISAMDETNPGTFATNWSGYPQETKDLVAQMNVHTYGTNGRTTVRDIAKFEDKPLWMSEVGGSWGDGQDFTSMAPGLGMAQHVVDDMRLLEPDAWVFWQPVEDYDNMAPGGESEAGANWGSIQLPFDCTASDTLETCPIHTNTKYDTVRNFTHYIEPGDTIVGTDNSSTVAALDADGTGASIVHVNDTASERTVRLDLSGFENHDGAVVTPIVTSEGSPLSSGTPVDVVDGHADLSVPARSVVTFEVSGVSGVNASTAIGQEGHIYRVTGVQSGLSLSSDMTIATPDTAAANQAWTVTRTGEGWDNTSRFTITSVDGTLLEAGDDQGQWILSTSGDGTYTLVNPDADQVLEVSGQSHDPGAPVGLYQPNSEANQLWRIEDVTIESVADADVTTLVGQVPTLPATVTVTTSSGTQEQYAADWAPVTTDDVASPGVIATNGTITEVTGVTRQVTATIHVLTADCVRDGHVTAAPGIVPALPATVDVKGADSDLHVGVPVLWDDVAAEDVAALGTLEVPGIATLPDGTTSAVTLVIDVIPAVAIPMADKPTVTASFSEPGYGTADLVNGDLKDKAWSNWKSSEKNVEDTLTATFGSARHIESATWYWFADGSSLSWPSSIQAQAFANGEWADVNDPVTVGGASGTGPVVEVPLGVDTDQVRFVMTSHEDTHMVASEVTFQALGINSEVPDRDLACTPVVRPTPSQSPSPGPTTTVTVTPSPTTPTTGGDLYSTPGFHRVNGRNWYTSCEPYSQTVRCRTEIWATQLEYRSGKFVSNTGWHFNNLTYLPLMTRAKWGTNPLANAGTFTSDSRKWKTECDTAETGRNGCRSWIWSNPIQATRTADGSYTYTRVEKWVFNNIVRFK